MKKILLVLMCVSISGMMIAGEKPDRFEISWYTDEYGIQNNVQKPNASEMAQIKLSIQNGRALSISWSSMGKINKELFVKVKTVYVDGAWITCLMKDKMTRPSVEVSSSKSVLFDGSESIFNFMNPSYGHDTNEGKYLHVIVRAHISTLKS